MKAMVSNPPLNAAQLLLLQSFSHIKSEESFEELKSVLFDFYRKKVDEETDKWWKENNMTTEKFEEMCSNMHYRTPYTTK
jgi:hypothetical protein